MLNKAAPLLGFATFLLSPVPVGPPIIWGAVGFVLIQQGNLAWGLFVLAWGTLVVSMVDNVIKPRFMQRGLDLPGSLTILSLLVWSWLLGPFVSSHYRAYGDAAAALSWLAPGLPSLSMALTTYFCRSLSVVGSVLSISPMVRSFSPW